MTATSFSTRLAVMTAPYDRLPAETDAQWRAFVAFRDIGPTRSIRKACEVLGKRSPSQFDYWARDHNWRERCAAWDTEVDRRMREEFLRQAEASHREMANVAEAMWQFAGENLLLYIQKLEERKKKLGNDAEPVLSPSELNKLAEAGMKLHRLALDQPSDILEQRHDVKVEDKREMILKVIKDDDVRKSMEMIHHKLKAANGDG